MFIYNLYFDLLKLYTNIQQDQKAKLDYHMSMSMLFAYMAGGEGVGVRGFKMFCQRESEFFLLVLCVGGSVRFSTSPSLKKITDSPPINKRLVPITKSPKGHYVAYLFKDISCIYYFLF